ncbi:MAG: hypothetical protein AAF488_06320 [Planctomycetota bacterium]
MPTNPTRHDHLSGSEVLPELVDFFTGRDNPESLESVIRDQLHDRIGELRTRYDLVVAYATHPMHRNARPWQLYGCDDELVKHVKQRAIDSYKNGLKLILPVFDTLLRSEPSAKKDLELHIEFGKHDRQTLIAVENLDSVPTLYVDHESTKQPVGPRTDPATLFSKFSFTQDFNASHHLFDPDQLLFQEGMYPTTQLLLWLGLTPTTRNAQAVLGGLRHLFEMISDRKLSSVILKAQVGSEPFDFSVSALTLSTTPHDSSPLCTKIADVWSGVSPYCTDETLPESGVQLHEAIELRGSGEPKANVPQRVVTRVLKGLHHPRRIAEVLNNQVARFLADATQFCSQKLEGVPQEFGLLLGNAMTLRNWPGARPLPIAPRTRPGGSEQLPTLPEIIKQTHLIENPRQRITVLPYGAVFPRERSENRPTHVATVLDVAGFRDSIASWTDGLLWSSTGVIYAWLTRQYPGTVATVAGPGSVLRVFVDGEVVAHRDGQAWNVRSETELDGGLGQLMRAAVHLSPFVRLKNHGGMIVGSREEVPRFAIGQSSRVTRLSLKSFEPPKLGVEDVPWLTGRNVVKESRLSLEVGKLMLRAAMIDGAVCLKGPDLEIYDFGQRILCLPQTDQQAPASGTKHSTAQSFADGMGPGAFAIAVSADGPIRVYQHGQAKPHEVFTRIEHH